MRSLLFDSFRKFKAAARSRGLEARLAQLGMIGGAVFLALVGTLYFVQRSLDRSQRQLAELAVPAEVRIAQLESSLNAAFRRENQIAATVNSAQLSPLRDRRGVESQLREAGDSNDIAAASTPGTAPDLAAHVGRFLTADADFFDAVEHSHAANAAFDAKLADTHNRIHAIVDEARSLSGKLQLSYVLQLRALTGAIDRGAMGVDLVRGLIMGPGRSERLTTMELVEAAMELAMHVDDIDDTSTDQLSSLEANTFPQIRALLERLLASLQTSLADDPELRARVEVMAGQFSQLMPLIAGGANHETETLMLLRRRVLAEEMRAAAVRVETGAAALQLESDTQELHRDIAALVARSVTQATLARVTTRAFSLLVVFAGLLACLLAARRIGQGIDELTAKNRSLTELKENLTALNASLDARVAERTQALHASHDLLKREMVEREKVEVELRLAQKLESLGRLSAGVAHEINTPVQFVSDSVYFIQESLRELLPLLASYRRFELAVAAGTATPEQANQLSQAREAADLDYALEQLPGALDRSLDGLGRIAVIVRSMKEFAHPDQKEMAQADLNRAIETTLSITRSEYKLVAEVETKLGKLPPVSCYASEINQVLLNVIVNAAHAIEDVVRGTDRKGLIRIETAQDGETVTIAISDTGGGIPLAIRDQIFDPFFTTKEIGKGTGQGLAIARSVIREKHGGSLTFETEMGKGTTFTIRLPIAQRIVAADRRRPATAKSNPPSRPVTPTLAELQSPVI